MIKLINESVTRHMIALFSLADVALSQCRFNVAPEYVSELVS
jgi:hypothetical protein